ncbi:MAG: ATP-dependent Clp protease adaptor ClpS [Chloroflexi bacterium]|nr:ATP-dependent Clp protease adaptor ClpS [Chloroflexota bacterium]
MTERTTRPNVEPRLRDRAAILPPYNVLLHNDDVNTMDHVVYALLKSIPGLTTERAIEIMLDAHHNGIALVIVCPLELAELYRDRLESFSLTATIEKA